jgi:NhaP-type Na+/H+ or K+/H+ antiporter
LAGPGVLWGAILIGVTFKLILGYPDEELTWYQALTLGCVLSATDPVAVVALLKDLGASVRFNTLVEGESLMNDGTAMVFFMLFLDLSKGNSSTVTGVVVNFVRVAFGGPLLGMIIGILISFWMKRIVRDSVLSTNITFVGAYLCFYIAEFTWVKVSGILSIVVLGLYMSAVGKRKIYPESEHALHNVWGYIQYACETLIFILTGIVVGVEMIEESTITIWDWLRMLLFWFLMIGLRSLMVLTFYPLLKSIGYGLTKKELVVLIYGGLRGALGLCLSLIVGVD